MTSLLHVYTSDLTVENLSQIDEIIQALVEMCVGNTSNQRVIFEKQVNEPLNRLLGLSVLEEHQTCGQRDTDQVRRRMKAKKSSMLFIVIVSQMQVFGRSCQGKGKCCSVA